MSEVNIPSSEFDEIKELAVLACEKTKNIIDTDAEKWTANWDKCLQATTDDDENSCRSIAHAQLTKLLEITVMQKYSHLTKRHTVQQIVEGLILTGKMPQIDGRVARVDFDTDNGCAGFIHIELDAGVMGKCQAVLMNIQNEQILKSYMVTIPPTGRASTRLSAEMIDQEVDASSLDVIPASQDGNMTLIISASIPPLVLEEKLAEIKAASLEVDQERLATALNVLRDLYGQKRAATLFENSLGSYSNMTLQDFTDMRIELDKRVQQRGY